MKGKNTEENLEDIFVHQLTKESLNCRNETWIKITAHMSIFWRYVILELRNPSGLTKHIYKHGMYRVRVGGGVV